MRLRQLGSTAALALAAFGSAGEAAAQATYQFALATNTVNEGGAVTIQVTRTGTLTGAGAVTWTTANGTAAAGTDFGTSGSGTQRTGTLNWAAGTGGAKTITVGAASSNVPILNDTTSEADESFTIALSSPVGGALGAVSSTSVTIRDNDSQFHFGSAAITASEGGPNVELTVLRTGSTGLAQNVTWRTSNGTAMVGSDFGTTGVMTHPYGTLIFAAGETSKVIRIGPTTAAAPYVRINNDTTVEPPELFNITLSAPTNGAALAGGPSVAAVTIVSNENAVSMRAPTATFDEGSGAQEIRVFRSGLPSSAAVTVNYAVTTGTAVNGTHYELTPGQLTWGAGETGEKTIPVTIADDAGVNANRTFTVALSAASGAPINSGTTLVTIRDNENSVQFNPATTAVTEGAANVMLTVTRAGSPGGGSADVTWTAFNGTALAGTDFGTLGNPTPPSGTLHWNDEDGTSKQISIPILNDNVAEGAKNFTVQLSNPVGPNVSIGANPTATVTLNDNDRGLAWEHPSYSRDEQALPASITLRIMRVGPTGTPMSATWATSNGTATAGQDFGTLNNSAQRSGSVSWLATDATPKSITIPLLNDGVSEGSESFNVTLTPGAGIALAGPGTVAVTINDDDIPPQSAAQFSQPKYVVVEGTPNVVVTVNRVDLGGGFGLGASVNYSMAAGSAAATTDYTASGGTLTWLAGNSDPKTITIPIISNSTAEPPESFRVLLAGAGPGLGIDTPETTVLILDDDEPFPLDGAMPAGFSTPGDTTAGWHVSNDPGAWNGAFSLKSDMIDDGQTAGLEMAGTFAAGNVTQYVKISTEANFDTLQFFIDGVLMQTWSGAANANWQVATHPVAAGSRVLRWVYTKDGSVSVGSDAVYLDGLMTPAFTPAP